MKNLTLAYLFLTLILGCRTTPKEYAPLKLKGSESLHEVFKALKNDFEKKQDTLKVLLEGGGSRTGLSAIVDKTADIGLSSFEFDLLNLLGENHGISEKIIAYDGIVIINNFMNPVRELSNDQIAGIYSGKISDWSQIGWKPGIILPVVRDSNSGTQKFFSNYFKISEISSNAVVAKENSEILDSVVSNENGIGFVGYSYFTSLVNNISLESTSENDSVRFIPPVSRFIDSGDYPLKRALRIYYEPNGDDRIKAFLKYLNTDKAKSIISDYGLILP